MELSNNMPSLEDMASKGKRKYEAKLSRMESAYSAAIPRAKEHYGNLPFGSVKKSNYNAAMDDYAVEHYRDAIGPEAADKWYDNWIAKMRE